MLPNKYNHKLRTGWRSRIFFLKKNPTKWRRSICGDCGFTIWDCWSVSKTGAWPPVLTTAETTTPTRTHSNTHTQSLQGSALCDIINQSDIASIDRPQKSLLLFDDLSPLFVRLLTPLCALWILRPSFNLTPTFKSKDIYFPPFHAVHHHPLCKPIFLLSFFHRKYHSLTHTRRRAWKQFIDPSS